MRCSRRRAAATASATCAAAGSCRCSTQTEGWYTLEKCQVIPQVQPREVGAESTSLPLKLYDMKVKPLLTKGSRHYSEVNTLHFFSGARLIPCVQGRLIMAERSTHSLSPGIRTVVYCAPKGLHHRCHCLAAIGLLQRLRRRRGAGRAPRTPQLRVQRGGRALQGQQAQRLPQRQ